MVPMSLAELALLPLRLWALLLAGLGLKKRNRPWGTVYDSITKQPLDPAYVVLQNEKGEVISDSITDLDGRFGFFATNPGSYKIVANKTNYIFPSQKLAGKGQDELYSNLYFGEALTITEQGAVITKNIPLDPEKFDWNEFAKGNQKIMKFYSRRDRFMRKFTDWAFRVGLTITLIASIIAPEPYNLIMFGLYIVMVILRHYGIRPRPYGFIKDKETGNPLSFGIVHVISAVLNQEVVAKVCDKIGRYYCLVPNGNYYLKIERKNSDESYTHIYTSPVIEVKNGIINQEFNV